MSESPSPPSMSPQHTPSAGSDGLPSMAQALPPVGLKKSPSFLVPLLLGGMMAMLIAMLFTQQAQITHLSDELAQMGDTMKASDVRMRLASQEANLDEISTRLAYLDSKIVATDRKAQAALDRLDANEKNDVIGNMFKGIRKTLGMQ